MRKLLVALVLASVIAGVAAAFALASTKSITIRDNFFSRSSLKIKRGTKVTWRWDHTQNAHNVTAIKGARFHSPTKKSGTYSRVFRRKGTYTIICTLHPTQMRLKIRVV